MQFEHLRYLKAVVDSKSMSKAAERLYCTQPTVSAAIKSIESELGYPVIERTPKGVTPTKLGSVILEDGTFILSCYKKWKEYAESLSDNQAVDIIMTGTAATPSVIRAISKTMTSSPDLEINVIFQHEPTAAMSHVGGRVGIQHKVPGHVSDAVQFGRAHGLRLALLQRDEFCLCVNARSPLLELEEVKVSDIQDMQLMLYQNPERFPYLKDIKTDGLRLAAQMHNDNNLMTAISLMPNAVSIRPWRVVENDPNVVAGTIKTLAFSDLKMPVNLYISYPIESRMFESERCLIDNLKKQFPDFEVID